MKATELIAKLQTMVAERGDLDLYVSAGDEGMEPLERIKLTRVRKSHAKDYFGESAIPEDEEKLHSDSGLQGLGKLYPANENEPYIAGIFVGR